MRLQSLIVLSVEAEASFWPSGLKVTLCTRFWRPSRVLSGTSSSRHSRTVFSKIAEARVFRAWEYRYLVSTYGDIPLLKEPVQSAKADFTRAPVADIQDLMVEDFKFASENLPRPGQEAAPGRITQGPAWHYLAETYLEHGKPKLAVDAATHVVNDYKYALMNNRFGTGLGNNVFKSGDAY